jgi:hypothetical protein
VRSGEAVRDVCLATLIGDVAHTLRPGLMHYAIRFEQAGNEKLQVRTFSSDLAMVLEEVLFNALEATGDARHADEKKKLVVNIERSSTQ